MDLYFDGKVGSEGTEIRNRDLYAQPVRTGTRIFGRWLFDLGSAQELTWGISMTVVM